MDGNLFETGEDPSTQFTFTTNPRASMNVEDAVQKWLQVHRGRTRQGERRTYLKTTDAVPERSRSQKYEEASGKSVTGREEKATNSKRGEQRSD